MVFLLAVVVGALFAWKAVQIGFYATWIMLFNLAVSAYLAISLAPLVVAGVPPLAGTPYGYALALLGVAVAALLIAYGTCFACLSGRMRIEFPAALDKPVAGIMGFSAGFAAASFVIFAFSLTPLSRSDLCKSLGCDAQSQQSNISHLCWWCNVIGAMVSAPEAPPSQDMVATLFAAAETEKPGQPPPTTPQLAAAPPAAPADKTTQPAGDQTKTGEPPGGIAPPAAPNVARSPAIDEQRNTAPETLAGPLKSPAGPTNLTTESPRRAVVEQPPGEDGRQPAASQSPAAAAAPPAVPKSPPKGPLDGTWQASTGALFHIGDEDDGQAITLDLVSSDALQVFTGKLVRHDKEKEKSGAKTYEGRLDAIFAVDAPKQYTVKVTVTATDADHLRLRFTNWPIWNNAGKLIGRDRVLTDVWMRSATPPPDQQRSNPQTPTDKRTGHNAAGTPAGQNRSPLPPPWFSLPSRLEDDQKR